MRQSMITARQVFSKPRRIENFRRSTWTPRRVRRGNPEVIRTRDHIPGEYAEPPRAGIKNAARRVIGLASDLTLLALLSPFFAVWFAYRGFKRWKS
jgi:hypothetical protein